MLLNSSLLIFVFLSLASSFSQMIRMPLKQIENSVANPSELKTSFLAKFPSIAIKNFLNKRFLSTIQIGSRNQEFDVILDTGSTTLWIGEINQLPFLGNGFNCSQSKTCKPESTFTKNFTYGTGNIQGYKIQDNLKIGNVVLPSHSLILANSTDSKLKGIQGILGLSLGRGSMGFPTILEQMKSKGLIKVGMFSMYLGNDGKSLGSNTGEIIFGGYDPKYAVGAFQFIRVKTEKETSFWRTELKGLGVGSKSNLSENLSVIFDSGTSVLILPEQTIKNFIQEAKQNNINCLYSVSKKKYQCDCSGRDKLGNLTFYFNGAVLSIPASYYIEFNYGCCDLMMLSIPGLGDDEGVIGDVFLKHFYTMYTADNYTIGFAPAKVMTHIPNGIILLIMVAGLLIISIIVFCCTRTKKQNDSKVVPSKANTSKRLLENDANSNSFY